MIPPRKKGWIYTSNIYAYLFSKALLALLLLWAAQAFFYLANTRIFHVAGPAEWLGIVWGNLIFGIATIGCLMLPYFAANLLPFKFRWNNHYHRLTEILLYYVPVLFIIISDICDASYYQYTYRRLTGEIFQYLGISGNMGSLWPHFLVDYWHSTLFGLILIFLTFFLGNKIRLRGRNKYRSHKANDIVGLILGTAVVIFLLRGGFGKNLTWNDTTNYCQAKNSALVTNSGYNIVRTFNGGTLSAGILVKIPICHGGENLLKYRKAQAEARTWENELENTKELIGLQVNQQRHLYNEALQRLQLADANLNSAEENLRTARIGYDAGVIPTNTVLAAHTAWLSAHSEMIDAGIALQLSAAALRKAQGK